MAANWGSDDRVPDVSGMEQQTSSSAGQGRPATCYNCGSCDHYVVACPEDIRQMPAGLLAVRAAQNQSPQTGVPNQHGQDSRPFKRQKTGPVVTKYPPPSAGAVITRYHPPSHPTPYSQGPGPTPGYYGPAASQYQQFQPYPQSAPSPNASFVPYGQHVTAGFPQQHGQNLAGPPQGYPQNAGHYPQPYHQPAPYGYGTQPHIHDQQNYQNASYGYGHLPGPQQHEYSAPTSFSSAEPSPNYGYHQGPAPGPMQYAPMPSPQQQPQWGPTHPMPAPHDIQSFQQPSQQQYTQPYPSQQYSGGPYPRRRRQSKPRQHPDSKAIHHGQHGSPVYAPPQQYPAPVVPSRSSSVQSNPQAPRVPVSESPVQQEAEVDDDYGHDFMYAFKATTLPPANPIGRPLPSPSEYTEGSIHIPAPNAKGTVCKYIRPTNLEVYIRDIRNSPHWPFVKNDPVFNEIAWDAPLVLLKDIIAWFHHGAKEESNQQPGDDPQCQVDSRKRAWSNDVPNDGREHPRQSSPHFRQAMNNAVSPPSGQSSTPTIGRQVTPSFGAEDDAWAPQPGEGQSISTTASDPTEALLASLGVTGAPKPQEKTANLITHNSTGEATNQGFERSVTGSGHGPHGNKTFTAEHPEKKPSRKDSGYVSSRGSYSNGFVHNQGPSKMQAGRGQSRQIYRPPPPPPPPVRRHMDGVYDSPLSDESLRDAPQNLNWCEMKAGEPDGVAAGPQNSSPLSPTSAELLGQMPTPSQEINGRKPEPLRQVDDVTPKLRRRQPRVAEAYSRRW